MLTSRRQDIVSYSYMLQSVRQPCHPARAGLAVLACAALWWHGLAAAQLVIGPTVVEFGAKQKVAAVNVTLDSQATTPMRLQANVQRWRQNVKGEDIHEETAELLVTPPVADLKPGQRQTFRLALRGSRSEPEEMAYRLILEDISETTGSAQLAPNMKIDFRMRYDLPVMLAPVNAVANRMMWKPCKLAEPAQAKDSACVRVFNAGNRRVKVKTMNVAGDGWQQALQLGEGENVLAGAEREWRIQLQAGHTAPFRHVHLQTASGETLQLEAGGF